MPYPDLVRYPYGTVTLDKSTETPYGTHPKSDVTAPEKIYPANSTKPGEPSYEPTNSLGRRHWDYESVWPISTSEKRWLTKRT